MVIGGDPVAFTVSWNWVYVYVIVNWSSSVGVTCGPVGVYGGLSVDKMVGVVYTGNVTTDVCSVSEGIAVVGVYEARDGP